MSRLSPDIVERLCETAGQLVHGTLQDGDVPVVMLVEAADEIERLRSAAQARQEPEMPRPIPCPYCGANPPEEHKPGCSVLAPAQPRWMPIETAPKDYTPILAIENFTRVDDDQLPYPPEQMVVQFSKGAGKWASFGIIVESFQPTHWMPLPTPPLPSTHGEIDI